MPFKLDPETGSLIPVPRSESIATRASRRSARPRSLFWDLVVPFITLFATVLLLTIATSAVTSSSSAAFPLVITAWVFLGMNIGLLVSRR